MTTGGTQGMHGVGLDTLGRSATGLDYRQLNVLAIFNGGGGAVTTMITFANPQLGPSNELGLLMVGAVNGVSSPVTVTSSGSRPGRDVDDRRLVRLHAAQFPATGRFVTNALINNDSRCIVIDLGHLAADGTITLSLNHWLNDGIIFAFGEELVASTSVPAPPGGALSFRPFHPNPARNTTAFEFSLPTASRARVDLFDVSGRHLARLADGEYPAGPHRLSWDLRDHSGARVPAGIVLAKLTTPAGVLTRRLVVAR